MVINISIINQSTQLSNTVIQAAIPDLQTQITRDFFPVWGVNAQLVFTTGTPPQNNWQLIILDSYSQANVLGYHETTIVGLPIGYVFLNNSAQANVPWTVTASHELLEMLGDPDINLSVLTDNSPYQTSDETWLFAYEICDPVQDVSLAYMINSTKVSDFVYPSWFESFWQPFSTQFDYSNNLFVPFQVGSGGYAEVNQVTSNNGWQTLAGSTITPPNGQPLDRIKRRALSRRGWRRSLV